VRPLDPAARHPSDPPPTGRDSPLRPLTADERPEYFRGVHPLWGGGLDLESFVAYQRRLAASPEAEWRFELLGYFEAGRMLSAMKVYRLEGQHEGTPMLVRGIGAVFTPPPLRRHGYAARMMRLGLQRFAAEGSHAALLFSDIGLRYYERLGFRALESAECKVDASMLPKGRGARAAMAGDEVRMAQALARHRANAAGVTLARDGWSLRFQLRRLRELARARNVGEPDWGLIVDGPGNSASAAAMIRHTKDGLDILDAAWDTGAGRDALLGAVRDRLSRAGRSTIRYWPAHQLRGLFPAGPRTSALAMVATLQPLARAIPLGARAELALLDHI